MRAPVQEFIAKWRERWPEWSIAEVFVPSGQRPLVAAWFALLQELTLAAWAGDEPAPGRIKLAWWQDELNGWGKRRRRHPLGEILLARPLSWTQLAQTLNGLSLSRDSAPGNTAAAAELLPLAQVLLASEAVLFEDTAFEDTAASAADPRSTDPRSTLLDLLAEQALLRGDAPSANQLLAERARLPLIPRPRPRRLQSAILAGRLRQLQRGQPQRPLPRWRCLLEAWRAARA